MPSKPKQSIPAAVPEADTPKREAPTDAWTPKPLTELQKLVADECADLVHNGSQPVVTAIFLKAIAYHHEYRWRASVFGDSEITKNLQDIGVHAAQKANEWSVELRARWQATRKAEPETPQGATATERFRTSVIAELDDLFDRFLVEGNPEEKEFMLNVLRLREGNGYADSFERMEIVEIIDQKLNGRSTAFMQVPEHLHGAMDAHLKLLVTADACKGKSA